MRKEFKQNVLIVHNRYQQRGGEDTVVENEKNLLEAHGHKVILYTRDNRELNNYGLLRRLSLPFAAIFNPRTYKEIRNIIRRESIDIVHVHNTLTLISPSVYYAAQSLNIPVVHTVHNFRLLCPNALLYRDGHICEDCLTKGLFSAVKHGCYRNSRLQTLICVINTKLHRASGIYGKINYICLTDFNREKLLKVNRKKTYIDPARVFVKPNFTPDFNLAGNGASKREGFIYAGRLEEIKGARLLIQAWRLMGDAAPKLVIVGTGELEGWCREEIKDGKLNIELKGYKSHPEVMALLASAKSSIMPTLCYEGFGMAVIEANSVSTPVIVSDIGNAAALVREGENGLHFKTIPLEEAAAKLAQVVLKFDDLMRCNDNIEVPTQYRKEENYNRLKEIYGIAGAYKTEKIGDTMN